MVNKSMNDNVDIEAENIKDSRDSEKMLLAEEQENEPDRQPEQGCRSRRKIRVILDKETELTNEQIIEVLQGVIDDLDEAEIPQEKRF